MTLWLLDLITSSSIHLMQLSLYTFPEVNIFVQSCPCLLNSVPNIKYVDLAKVVIGRLEVAFKTEFIDSSRSVVIWPHRCPSSNTQDHYSFWIFSAHLKACLFSLDISSSKFSWRGLNKDIHKSLSMLTNFLWRSLSLISHIKFLCYVSDKLYTWRRRIFPAIFWVIISTLYGFMSI